MKIKSFLEKTPGGMMLIPMLIGAIIHTFWPDTLAYFGPFTNALGTGSTVIIAVWFVGIGASIKLKATPKVLKKSGVLLATKMFAAYIACMIVQRLIPQGMITEGLFIGFSALAVVAAMDMTNAGLYTALTKQYGTTEEAGASLLLMIESGPLFTMVVLGTTGLASFPIQNFIGLVLPFLLGFILGNLDEDFRVFLTKLNEPMIIFLGFSLGSTINLHSIYEAGIAGIILAFSVIIFTGFFLILSDIFLAKGNGTAGIAASSTAGAAGATPMLIAQLYPELKEQAKYATVLVSTCVVITAFIVPILTSYYAKWAKTHIRR
ncbi:2-keto-3-deoxygluconate permease [Campylobacter taeniopygiae]|uniref:2-keto-3-deoxygluconate permease n=1 Tax=Campylobacter taeniopygiae TaxID=2510188 RepID=A0ABY2TI95_9BACT|nr:2-keto-3-deoxygluconate permease [Campylobacter taeniopygiae]TKX33842.1 2-keto-3-deoxygluconate permease [Campylobacter taeniopygiae]